jgi:hypothetical protein
MPTDWCSRSYAAASLRMTAGDDAPYYTLPIETLSTISHHDIARVE